MEKGWNMEGLFLVLLIDQTSDFWGSNIPVLRSIIKVMLNTDEGNVHATWDSPDVTDGWFLFQLFFAQ